MPGDFLVQGRLRIDDTDLKRIPAQVRRQTAKVQGTKAEVRAELNDTQVKARILELQRRMGHLSGTAAYPKVALINGTKVDADLLNLRRRMLRLASSVAHPAVELTGEERTIADIRQIRRELQSLGQGTTVPVRTARTGAAPAGGATAGASGTTAMAGGMLAGRAGLMGGIGGMVASMGVFGGMRAAQSAYGPTIGAASEKQKLEGIMEMSFGPEVERYREKAKQLSEATGFMAQDFEKASLSAWTLVNNYDMQHEQMMKLLEVSADLAATSPFEDLQSVPEVFQRLQDAARGNSESVKRLGMTMNDQYLKEIAFNGALKDTWSTMNDVEKAHYRYQEILNQTGGVAGAAAKQLEGGGEGEGEGEDYVGNVREMKKVWKELGQDLGEELIPLANDFAKALRDIGEAIPDWVPEAVGTAAEHAPTYAKVQGLTSIPGSMLAAAVEGPRLPEHLRHLGQMPQRDEWRRSAHPRETQLETKIILEDRTSAGVRATDEGSYTPVSR